MNSNASQPYSSERPDAAAIALDLAVAESMSADRYQDIPLGVECAWPADLRL